MVCVPFPRTGPGKEYLLVAVEGKAALQTLRQST
jgi:hypothetical protein